MIRYKIAAVAVALSALAAEPAFPQAAIQSLGRAPIGHLQPRASEFLAGSAAEQAEQNRESDFDAEQKKQDMEFDKKLNICRCGTERPIER